MKRLAPLSKEARATLDSRIRKIADRLEDAAMDTRYLENPEVLNVVLFSEFIAEEIVRSPEILLNLHLSRDLDTAYSPHTFENRISSLGEGDVENLSAFKEDLVNFKTYEAVRIAWRDLSGRAGLDETLADLSALARACIQKGIDTLYRSFCHRHGTPVDANGNFQQVAVLGMGKLGAGELNFSSDIDLIFVYKEEGYTASESPISNDAFFTKLCRAFLRLFATEGGRHLYRVDTRLRPFGDSGPLVMSAAAFEDYYQAQGREWERYAMIKARPVAGDVEGGNAILKALNPFIFRRYFDYGSFDSFRDMKQRIAAQVKNRKLRRNIKLGAGGIREVEFFGQLFQLIRGGVEPALQRRPILIILDLLVTANCIDQTTCNELKDSYRFLRRVENRLQAYRDHQTHDIPEDPVEQEILALSMGYDNFDAFSGVLNRHLERVHHHFSQLLVQGDEEDGGGETRALNRMWNNMDDPGFSAEATAVAGFKYPEKVHGVLRDLAEHPNTRRLTPSGRKKLDLLVPKLVKAAAGAEDSLTVLIRLVDLIVMVERRTCYLSLLIENRGSLENLVTLASKSPWIVSFLSQHPALLDELMHPATLYAPPRRADLEGEMARRMERVPENDLEFLLEELNIFRHVNTLRVAAADVSGNYPIMKVSDHLTFIAETILNQILISSWQIVARKFGVPEDLGERPPAGKGFAVLTYGKVGGFEMGYKSDLDLVFLYRGDPGMTRGGARSIDTGMFYVNLAQRIIHALTMHTSAGTLYGADMRLRPGGDSGTIVSHLEAYEYYLEHQAWTWEHQALIRARAIAGDPGVIEEFERIRHHALTRERDYGTLKKEVREMRERMRDHRLKSHPGLFDLKQGRGGIVDIEFLVQYLVLRYAREYPDLIVWTDNIRLMESLSLEGLISAEESGILQDAYISMRRALHRLTLQELPARVDDGVFLDQTRAVAGIYDRFMSER